MIATKQRGSGDLAHAFGLDSFTPGRNKALCSLWQLYPRLSARHVLPSSRQRPNHKGDVRKHTHTNTQGQNSHWLSFGGLPGVTKPPNTEAMASGAPFRSVQMWPDELHAVLMVASIWAPAPSPLVSSRRFAGVEGLNAKWGHGYRTMTCVMI